MARRQLNKEEEEILVREAEARRDADTEPSNLRMSANASAVLSVRLPMNELRTLRAIAKARGVSISALLQDAVEQLLAAGSPSVSFSRSAIRFAVTGAQLAEVDRYSTVSVNIERPSEAAITGIGQLVT